MPGSSLQSTFRFKIRFSEVDAMRVVWHGAYAKYLEDAREYFGQMYGLDYNLIVDNGFFAPIVDMSIQYKQPLRYGMQPEMTITYCPTEAAKIIFDYEIRHPEDGNGPDSAGLYGSRLSIGMGHAGILYGMDETGGYK